MTWICDLRIKALERIIQQDKLWFDKPENSTTTLSNMVVKDTEDARTLVATIIGSFVVVISMMSLGLTWAFVAGWELTFVGLGMAPIFIIATRVQAELQSKYDEK